MRIAVLCYHKNARLIYPNEWLEQYKESVLNQTYKDFSIMEINYGGGLNRIFETSYFESVKMPTFVHALNYLLDKCFSAGYDFVFNSNVDDWFSLNRIEKQLPYLKKGYDIVSSNFALVKDGVIVKYHRFHRMNILQELNKNHNLICHPSIGYSRYFWQTNRYNPDEVPEEDLKLWKRAVTHCKMIVLEDNLVFHRLHNQSICQSENR